jgi:hypothetical protein
MKGPGLAVHGEPVRSGAVGRDAGDLGEGTALVERQLDGTCSELDIPPAKAPRHREAAVSMEPLARGYIRNSQLEQGHS